MIFYGIGLFLKGRLLSFQAPFGSFWWTPGVGGQCGCWPKPGCVRSWCFIWPLPQHMPGSGQQDHSHRGEKLFEIILINLICTAPSVQEMLLKGIMNFFDGTLSLFLKAVFFKSSVSSLDSALFLCHAVCLFSFPFFLFSKKFTFFNRRLSWFRWLG